MKTQTEINENIKGCKAKIEESYQNEQKFASVMTPAMASSYAKTRAYIAGWIDCLEDNPKDKGSQEYDSGYKNANDWRSRND